MRVADKVGALDSAVDISDVQLASIGSSTLQGWACQSGEPHTGLPAANGELHFYIPRHSKLDLRFQYF